MTRYETGLQKYYESLFAGGKEGGIKSKAIAKRYGLSVADKAAMQEKAIKKMVAA